MPLFSSTWFTNSRDPPFASAAGTTAAVIFAVLVAYRQQKRITASQRSGAKEIPTAKEQYPLFDIHLQLFPSFFFYCYIIAELFMLIFFVPDSFLFVFFLKKRASSFFGAYGVTKNYRMAQRVW